MHACGPRAAASVGNLGRFPKDENGIGAYGAEEEEGMKKE
jgi:hypothetical protein